MLDKLNAADFLRRAGEARSAVAVQLHEQVAAGEMDVNRTLTPTVCDRGRGGRYRACPRRERLAGAALPHAHGEIVWAVDPNELNIRPFGEPRMALDLRAEPPQLAALRLSPQDGVRIPDRYRRELDPLITEIECLGLPHFDAADVELDLSVAEHDGFELPASDLQHTVTRAGAPPVFDRWT